MTPLEYINNDFENIEEMNAKQLRRLKKKYQEISKNIRKGNFNFPRSRFPYLSLAQSVRNDYPTKKEGLREIRNYFCDDVLYIKLGKLYRLLPLLEEEEVRLREIKIKKAMQILKKKIKCDCGASIQNTKQACEIHSLTAKHIKWETNCNMGQKYTLKHEPVDTDDINDDGQNSELNEVLDEMEQEDVVNVGLNQLTQEEFMDLPDDDFIEILSDVGVFITTPNKTGMKMCLCGEQYRCGEWWERDHFQDEKHLEIMEKYELAEAYPDEDDENEKSVKCECGMYMARCALEWHLSTEIHNIKLDKLKPTENIVLNILNHPIQCY